MHDLHLITTLTGALGAALVFGYITHRVGLSPIVGYLLAGVAIGPSTPGFAADTAIAAELAEVGVILLMFGVGLQFHFKELLAVRKVAVPGAIVQSLAATILGAIAARAAGWDWVAGVVLGLAISVASTVVLVRVLSDNRALHTKTGHIAVGWLVVEDIFTVVVLVLLPALFGGEAKGIGALPLALGLTALKLAALLVAVFWGGNKAIPWLLGRAAATQSREIFTLAVLALALGIAVGASALFGVSMALGAFLAGMVVGRSEFSLRAASEALPMRDAFAVIFFVSVGMLFEPAGLLQSPGLAAAVLAIVLVGKPLAALVIVVALRYPLRTALSVAVALAQIGEFSFILATLSRSLGILPESATNILVAASIVSITLNPLLYRSVDRMEPAFRPLAARLGLGEASAPAGEGAVEPAGLARSGRHRAIVIGHGPVGRGVVRLLRENEIDPVVIEMNLETVRRLREEGLEAYYGDASREELLAEAGVGRAESLIISADLPDSRELIRRAREANPAIRILARAAYLREIPALRAAGAGVVFSGEGEVALAFTVAVLQSLGATPDQIDAERERVRAELLKGAPNTATPPPSESNGEASDSKQG